ncbi:MAG: Amuc_1100 family pilus-like protein [Puniceicoccales bacterium]|nr:Amuc_1100 family pilus-like protein [Puniceicoccales bacterium]
MNFTLTKKRATYLSAIIFLIILFLALPTLLLATIKKMTENKNLDEANRKLRLEVSHLQSTKPQPTEATLTSLRRRASAYELRSNIYLEEYRKYSLAITDSSAPKNEVDLYFSLMSLVKSLHTKAIKARISVPKDYYFAFEPYVKKDLIPRPEEIHLLYSQSLAILKLLSVLFKSNENEMALISVERESISLDKNKLDAPDTFSSAKFNSFRTKGAESSLFTITFAGYTRCFRNFLNGIAQKSLPVLFKEIKISPLDSKTKPDNKPQAKKEEKTIVVESRKSKIKVTVEWLFMNNNEELLRSEQVINE